MARAFVFPGQGSQAVGMGRELAARSAVARAVFEEVDDALDQDLSGLMFEGDAEALTLTENAQPALMAVSLAVARVLEHAAGRPLTELATHVAGHSLGEYSALAAVRSLSAGEAARLLRRRGRAMQAAVPVGEGGMAALFNADLEAAQAIVGDAAHAGEVCAVANDNAPGQVVISGHAPSIRRALALAAERGARRSVMLAVSAPFHCPLMAPAGEVMAEALEHADLREPSVPIIANVTAEPTDDVSEIRSLLVRQVTSRVRWRESILEMRDRGITEVVELGAGRVLTGLTRRIDRGLAARALHTPAEVDAFLEAITTEL